MILTKAKSVQVIKGNPVFGRKDIEMDARTKRPFKPMNKFVLIVMIALLCCCGRSLPQGHTGRANIPFRGDATGGTLVIGYVPSPHFVHTYNVSVDTSAGESAESVVNDLARAIAYSGRGMFGLTAANPEVDVARMAQANTLSIVGTVRDYLLAGTETGLGIPKPPHSLSCSYNNQAGTLEVKWANPPTESEYHSIWIRWRYRSLPEDTPVSGGGKVIPASPTSYTIHIPAEVNDVDLDVWLKGLRHEIPREQMLTNSIPLGKNAIPSNVAAIHVTSNGYCQQETYAIPFTAGVAPNWVAWSTAADVDKSALQQGDKYAGLRRYKPVSALSTKPFYQVIDAPARGDVHGVYRKFLGLTPGHTYRITACVSTLAMDSITGNWSLSLHAAPSGPGKDLTVQQLRGQAALPDGRSGPQAAQTAIYAPGRTTKGHFHFAITGYTKLQDGSTSPQVTLPAGVDEITVWIRFSCADPKGQVGFAGVKLEDISASPNVKSADQIISEEASAEAELLRREPTPLRRESL
jgi:hypothetical protein